MHEIEGKAKVVEVQRKAYHHNIDQLRQANEDIDVLQQERYQLHSKLHASQVFSAPNE